MSADEGAANRAATDRTAPIKTRATAADRLARRQQEIDREERLDAIRILVGQPLLPAEGPTSESFRLVRRHADWLKTWFARWPGWTLVIASDIARLRKHPSPRKDASRGLIEKRSTDRVPFSRRRYALLCLVLATLENEQRQTTLQQVARKVETTVRIDAELHDSGFDYEGKTLSHRRELVSIMRWLERMHVLIRADGDDKNFATGDSDCLYRIDRSALATILCSVRGASTVDANDASDLIEKLNTVETPEAPEAQNRSLQHQLVRRLLDDPIVYFDELTTREFDYFNNQGDRLMRELESVTGLIPERRAEGVAMLDPTGGWTDVGLPETGTRGHATLLVAEWLGNRLRETAEVDCKIPIAELHELVSALADEHAGRWRKGSNTVEGNRRILHDAIEVLCSLGLLEVSSDSTTDATIMPRPAIARFRISDMENENDVPSASAPIETQATLWEPDA